MADADRYAKAHGLNRSDCIVTANGNSNAPLKTPSSAFELATADQTRSASSPATTKPPTNIDQSPVSKPRSRPSLVNRRVVASRNMGEPYDLLTALPSNRHRDGILAGRMAFGCCRNATVSGKLHRT